MEMKICGKLNTKTKACLIKHDSKLLIGLRRNPTLKKVVKTLKQRRSESYSSHHLEYENIYACKDNSELDV